MARLLHLKVHNFEKSITINEGADLRELISENVWKMSSADAGVLEAFRAIANETIRKPLRSQIQLWICL